MSNIPTIYQGIKFRDYPEQRDVIKTITKIATNCKGAILHSPWSGIGKTYLAILMMELIRNNDYYSKMVPIDEDPYEEKRLFRRDPSCYKFYDSNELGIKLSCAGYKRDRYISEILENARCLLLDDTGYEPKNAIDDLIRIIRSAHLRGIPVIITTQYDAQEFVDRYGLATSDRLRQLGSRFIHVPGKETLR